MTIAQTISGLVDRGRASVRYRARGGGNRVPLLRDGDARTMWARTILNERMREEVTALKPEMAHAVEVSGSWWSAQPWRSYRSTNYPEFDLVAPPSDFDGWGQADVVICEQVLEHVVDPVLAMHHLVQIAKPGGTVLVNTPFLIKIHGSPYDYWRFTPAGLAELMRRSGC